jgi:hypothetical protein
MILNLKELNNLYLCCYEFTKKLEKNTPGYYQFKDLKNKLNEYLRIEQEKVKFNVHVVNTKNTKPTQINLPDKKS